MYALGVPRNLPECDLKQAGLVPAYPRECTLLTHTGSTHCNTTPPVGRFSNVFLADFLRNMGGGTQNENKGGFTEHLVEIFLRRVAWRIRSTASSVTPCPLWRKPALKL